MKKRGGVFVTIRVMIVACILLLQTGYLRAATFDSSVTERKMPDSDRMVTLKTEYINDSQAWNERKTSLSEPDDSLKANLLRANKLSGAGKNAEASAIFISLMQNYPDSKEAVQGWLIANMKRSPTGEEEAIQMLEDLAKKYPRNTGIIFFKMFLEAEHGRNEAALKDVETLISLQPDSAVNWVAKGQVLYELKQYPSSMEAFTRATALDPRRSDVWGMKAGAEAKSGRFDQALISVNKGIELAPNNFVGIYNRACIYALKGDKAQALVDLQKALQMNPGIKKHAATDEDFKSLFDDDDFIKLIK